MIWIHRLEREAQPSVFDSSSANAFIYKTYYYPQNEGYNVR